VGASHAATRLTCGCRDDGPNCLLIAVESPIELSHFVMVGVNLAIALCPTDTLAGLILSRAPRVVSARRGLMIEGGAALRKVNIAFRGILLPISEHGGAAIDHVLGAANYRLLPDDLVLMRPGIVKMQWI
jgi:hypothetical protein